MHVRRAWCCSDSWVRDSDEAPGAKVSVSGAAAAGAAAAVAEAPGPARFGCGAALNICRGSTCVKVAVVDYGPSCFVEDDAGGPVIDASPAVCQALTGGSSCGWSDHFSVTASVVGDDARPFGPFTLE